MPLSATLLCLLVAAAGNPPKLPYLAVMNLKAPGIEAGAAEAINSTLASELVRSGAFRVMERTQMDKILAEQGFQQSGACDKSECEVELGKLLSVDRIVVGALGRVGSKYSLSARMIKVQTGEILLSVTESGANSLEDAATDLVPLIADRLANRGESHKPWSLALSARGGVTSPLLGSKLAASEAWASKGASAGSNFAGALRVSKWWTRSIWTSFETGVQSTQFSTSCTWDSLTTGFREERTWSDEASLQTIQASLLTGFTLPAGFTFGIGATWNYPLLGTIHQSLHRTLKMADGQTSPLESPHLQLDPTSTEPGAKANTTQFAFEPFWDAVTEVGWTFRPGWHAMVRTEVSLTSFYLPIVGSSGESSMNDPIAVSSYSAGKTYGNADLDHGIRLVRIQASVGKSFPF